jgi:hypothetical protein
MAGLDPAIYVLCRQDVDSLIKSGHDGGTLADDASTGSA